MPKFLEDIAIRGSMSQRFADVIGVVDASFSFGGPVFGDVWGYFFDNLFGDLSTTGTSPANGTHITNSGGVVVGGTSVTVPSTTGYTNSSIVQIDSGASAKSSSSTPLAAPRPPPCTSPTTRSGSPTGRRPQSPRSPGRTRTRSRC